MEIKIISLNYDEIAHVFAFLFMINNMWFDIVALDCSFLNWKKFLLVNPLCFIIIFPISFTCCSAKHHPRLFVFLNYNVNSDHTSSREVMCAGKTVGETG